MAGGSTRTSLRGAYPTPGNHAAVIPPQLWPTTRTSLAAAAGNAARANAATSAALSRKRTWPIHDPVSPWPGRSGATTR